MAEPFLGEIKIMSFGFAPRGWALCNGQLLPINQNQALFALLGTYYGGDGRVTFALPNLRDRVPMGPLNIGGTPGETGGAETVTLSAANLPAHSHTPRSSDAAGTAPGPGGAVWARDSQNYRIYKDASGAQMASGAIGLQGGGQAHSNMQPYLVLNFCIALQGIFPSRN
jgi:microcystin-dependent protein